ncbi:hypothetical protein ZOSMA_48G00750 [Zostera marina]|uniref:Uncharacterized protein n=1 Tax=Zostera marina TaxID=29655 RepID=A0A0K9NZM0_ZOSMR|nr:hypothetical protein ZOSMA_48G00750 [Zostera marina]
MEWSALCSCRSDRDPPISEHSLRNTSSCRTSHLEGSICPNSSSPTVGSPSPDLSKNTSSVTSFL